MIFVTESGNAAQPQLIQHNQDSSHAHIVKLRGHPYFVELNVTHNFRNCENYQKPHLQGDGNQM